MNRTQRTRIAAAVALCATMAVSACGSNNSNGASNAPSASQPSDSASPSAAAATSSSSPSASPALEEVTLNWYYPQPSAQADQAAIEEAFNKITLEKLNAKVNLHPIDFGDYEQKMNTIFAAGASDVDLVWTSNWSFVYSKNAEKGAFLSLGGLLDQYGKDIKASMPDFVWTDVTLDGNIYAVPSYQVAAKRAGLVVQKRFADKYNLDVSSIKKLADFEPFFEELKKNEPDIVPFAINNNFMISELYGIVQSGSYAYYKDDPSLKLFTIYESPEYKDHIELDRRWYEKGYLNKDAATIKDRATLIGTGNAAASIDVTMKPGGEAEAKKQFGGNDVIFVPLTEAEFTGVQPTMNAVSRTSANPDRAMMLLNLINTDSELYNLISFGIEGKHYTKIGDNTIRLIEGSGYSPLTNWVFGNIMNGFLLEGRPADTFEQTKALNESAKVRATFGFNPLLDDVKTEVAGVKAVEEQYIRMLAVGVVAPDKVLPEFISKLKKAGSDKILAEEQKQLDEWLKTSKK
ncbi:ABC transporter substrate-binding protein [Cohnella fermenti]|uniref:Extracellular solute-binding protein n=1 Tax=Cohnella fermenti TaxID=2565925 RepID=A0A4S4C9V4_9BACL|nr:ABC transporter substrate-binding protein [Cohnella fermenti]THF84166.1 extracellular solute-binding protein [Cohnella fermenti]